MGTELVLVAVVLALIGIEILWPTGAVLVGALNRPRPSGRLSPRRLWTILLMHAFLVMSYVFDMWTWDSVGLETRQWEWSLGVGLVAFLLFATLFQPLLFSVSPAETWAQSRQAQRKLARTLAISWPRAQRARAYVAALGLALAPARVIVFYGILVYGFSASLGSTLAGALLGGMVQLLRTARLSRRRIVWCLAIYIVSLGLLFSGPGLLAVFVFHLMIVIQGNHLSAQVEFLKRYRRRTRGVAERAG